MANFLDFLTGGIQSTLDAPPMPAQAEPKPEGGSDIASRLKADLQRDFGLSGVQASAFVGNLAHESGGFKSLQEINPAVPGSRGGYGYAQWTGPRRRQFESWAAQNELDPTSYEANYGFLKHELSSTPEGRVLDKLKQAQDPVTATQIVSDEFLRPGIPGMGSRQKWTQRVLGGDAIGTFNPTITAAAERGRGPAADRPARGGMTAEGQMPMPQGAPPDLSNTNDAGMRDFILREAGMAPGQPANMPQQAMGGLGGLGGLRMPGGSPPQQSVESLLPFSKPNPFAFMGDALKENQDAELKNRGAVFAAKQLVAQGMSPQDAVAAVYSPQIGQQLALGNIKQQKDAVVNADVGARLQAGGGGASIPPSPPTAAAAPAEEPKRSGIDTGNKTVDALFAQRDAKLREYRSMSDNMIRATTDSAKSAVSARLKAIENEIGGIDKRTEQYAPTGTMREYVFAMNQRREQGLPVIPMEQFDQEQRKASKPEVKVEGTIPPGYQVERDAQGQPLRMTPIPGGPADVEAKEKAAKLDLTKKQSQTTGNVVLSALDDIDRLMKTATLPTTGALGARVSEIGGTASHDIASALTTIKANISFDRLQQMRAASPTGGALGGVAVEELRALQNSAAAVEQSQSPEQFKLNLGRLREQYNLVVHGPQTTRPDGSSPPKPTTAPSISEGARAKGPNGQVIVLRNGQWVPE